MKKCEQFKDLILTDYIDGELKKDLSVSLEAHLLDCSECRDFLREVKSNAVTPFMQIQRQPVPAELWDAVKQGIEDKNQTTDPVGDFIAQLKGLLFFPRMVPVFASLVLMLLVGSVTLNNVQIQQTKAQDQGEYLVSLLTPAASSSVESNDLGTPIEHYFL